MSLPDKPDDGLRYSTSDKFFTQKYKDDRYDTLIGVVLAFAMAIGVWMYAVKPWQTSYLNATVEVDNADSAKLTSTAPAQPVVEQPVIQASPQAQALPPVVAEALAPAVSSPLPKAPAIVPPSAKIEKPAAVPIPPVAAVVAPPPAPVNIAPVVTPKVVVPPPPVVEPPIASQPVVAPVVEAPAPKPPVVEEAAVATPPAPATTPEPLPANVVMRESIEFAMGNARVPEYAKARLREVAAQLKSDTRQLKIVGHTDNIGYTGANRRLSLRRAASVKAFLVAEGVNAEHLSVEGVGESQPIADNQTLEGRSRNRRIEIIE